MVYTKTYSGIIFRRGCVLYERKNSISAVKTIRWNNIPPFESQYFSVLTSLFCVPTHETPYEIRFLCLQKHSLKHTNKMKIFKLFSCYSCKEYQKAMPLINKTIYNIKNILKINVNSEMFANSSSVSKCFTTFWNFLVYLFWIFLDKNTKT